MKEIVESVPARKTRWDSEPTTEETVGSKNVRKTRWESETTAEADQKSEKQAKKPKRRTRASAKTPSYSSIAAAENIESVFAKPTGDNASSSMATGAATDPDCPTLQPARETAPFLKRNTPGLDQHSSLSNHTAPQPQKQKKTHILGKRKTRAGSSAGKNDQQEKVTRECDVDAPEAPARSAIRRSRRRGV